MFQMVWFHRSGLVFGGSVWSTSLVLSSFMAGLALGGVVAVRVGPAIRRFMRAYAAAELLVAVTGVVLTLGLPRLTQAVVVLTAPAAESLWLTNVVRFVTAFLVLLVPATAMGTTLPLLVAARARSSDGFGAALGKMYGWNTLGAVAGVIVAEVCLIRAFGVVGTAFAAGLLSAAAALAALRLSPGSIEASPLSLPSQASGDQGVRAWALLVSSFIAGATLLALEVIWFRFLTLYVLSTTLAASLMLAVVLAAIAAGGLVASMWLVYDPRAARHAPTVALAAGSTVIGAYAAFQYLTDGVQVGAWARTLWFAMVLTLPTSLLSGTFFTLLGDRLRQRIHGEARAAGWLALANTAGGMGGPLVAAFVLLPAIGTERAFFALAAAYVVIAGLALAGVGRARSSSRSLTFAATVIVAAIALIGFPFGLMDRVYIPRIARPYTVDGSVIVATREGPSETIFLMEQKWLQQPVYHRMVTNGFSMTGTGVPGMRYMRYFVYWPLVVHREPIKSVLIVCYGIGVTAEAALQLPAVESVDIAEISPDIVSMSDVVYEESNHPLRDPRTRLHVEDGRQFLQRTAKRFDLITGEPPPPRTPGAVNIYTREYFKLVRDRLADGGIATYWLPVGRPDPGTNVNAIISAFCEAFDDCSLWNATPFDLMLVGTRGALQPSESTFVEPWTLPALRARLSEVGFELPQQIGATFVGDAAYLRQLVAGAPPLTDAYPQRLHPAAGRPSLSDPGYGVDAEVTRLYQSVLDSERAKRAFAASSFIRDLWPARLVEGTLPYFEHQGVLSRVFWEGGRPLQQIDRLDWLLTRTPLRTLPLWLLGSDFVKERIARVTNEATGADEYARGLSALAIRDYPGAARVLGEAERLGLKGDTVRPLRVYATAMAGDAEGARLLSQKIQVREGEQQVFWKWLGMRFGVGPFAEAESPRQP
jgi:predicted membrane-bound spermidine synthase